MSPCFFIHIEARENNMSVAVFTFGRFNPPTTGHMALVDKVKAVAKQNRAKPFIFTSQSTDPKKNPLNYKTKTSYMKKCFLV